jgi:beta-mannanase
MDFNQKFEPKGNKIIHGAGQQFILDYKNYWNNVDDKKPILFMTYIDLKKINIKWCKRIETELEIFPNIIPQIAISMNATSGDSRKHYENRVCEGIYDSKIELFCKFIKKLKIPCFVRLGYEFNGTTWTGYIPNTYKLAWKRIVDIFRKNKTNNVAWIWHYAPEGVANYMEYYPGDDYVDWWGISLFGLNDLKNKNNLNFLNDAKKHKKPVMIAESSARGVGVLEGKKSWNAWFKPFFDIIEKNPVIKAFCYINWNWADYGNKGNWSDWGDCRISKNKIIKKNYIKELSKSKYIHNQKINEFLKIINN